MAAGGAAGSLMVTTRDGQLWQLMLPSSRVTSRLEKLQFSPGDFSGRAVTAIEPCLLPTQAVDERGRSTGVGIAIDETVILPTLSLHHY